MIVKYLAKELKFTPLWKFSKNTFTFQNKKGTLWGAP